MRISESSVAPPLKLGARLVVELLERNVTEDDFPHFTVSPRREPAALKQLQGLLTDVQRSVTGSPYAKASIKTLLHQKHRGPGRFPLSRLDLGAINLVDGLFDDMLAKGKFDSAAWELIARVKIPVLKIIIQDLSFLFMPKNVVRKFINSVALALIASPSGEDDPSRVAIGAFIDRIVQEYDCDVSVANIVCIDAQSWFAGNQQRLEKVQEKIVRTESSKNKKLVAEPRVVDLLNKHFSDTEQPELMHEFVQGIWRDVLRAISIEDGDTGSRWKRAAGITESMAVFYRECCEDEGRQKYQKFLPTMLKSVKILVSDAIKNRPTDDAIESFELIAAALVAGAIPDASLFPTLVVENDEVEVYERQAIANADEDALDGMSVGDWVRIKTSRSTIEACKLTVKASGDGQWIFVNQSGKKIAKKTRAELKAGLEHGTLQLIGKGLWVDDYLSHRFAELHLMSKVDLPPAIALAPKEAVSTEVVTNIDTRTLDEKSGSIELVGEKDQASTFHSGKKDFTTRTEDILVGSELQLEEALIDTSDKSAAKPAVEPSDEEVEEVALATLPPLSVEEIEAAQRAVENLQVSGWIMASAEVVDGSGQEDVRLKLAVIVKGGTKYIFVNRLGVKQLEINKGDFAESVARGDISIVDNGVQFSSALEKVVRNIQKDHR